MKPSKVSILARFWPPDPDVVLVLAFAVVCGALAALSVWIW